MHATETWGDDSCAGVWQAVASVPEPDYARTDMGLLEYLMLELHGEVVAVYEAASE